MVDDAGTLGSLRIFTGASIVEILRQMPPSIKEWMLEVLSDLCKLSAADSGAEGLFRRFCSLGVGPIRTARQGSVHFDDIESAIRLIRLETTEFSTEIDTLKRFGQMSSLNDERLSILLG